MTNRVYKLAQYSYRNIIINIIIIIIINRILIYTISYYIILYPSNFSYRGCMPKKKLSHNQVISNVHRMIECP
jgi:hypothetical protein